MLFRRRKPADFWERLRIWLWPRRSFSRSLRYIAKRIFRITASPHAVAAGVAAGIFASFTPFLGFHIIIAAIISWLVSGNVVASAIGTMFCNPLTVPFIWGGTFELGHLILHGAARPGGGSTVDLGDMLTHLDFAQIWGPILKPMAVGSIPLGVAAALVAYVVTRMATVAFREQRRRRLAERARRRAAAGTLSQGMAARG